jgi:hypothetical protein
LAAATGGGGGGGGGGRRRSRSGERSAGSPFLCGNVTIAFPFGLIPDGAAQTSCGAGFGFQVRCYDAIPHLGFSQSEISLKILSIFYHNRSLLLADRPWFTYFNRTSTKGCRIPTANTSSRLAPPLSVSSDNQNLIFYNCTKPPSPGEGLVATACHNNTFVRATDGRRSDESGDYVLEGCTATKVPVLGVSGKVINASNYDQLVWDGFLATWQQRPPLASGNFTHSWKFELKSLTVRISVTLALAPRSSIHR